NMINTPGKAETGFIAQNVQEVFPQAVSIVDPEHGYMGVSYVSFIPVLTSAVQELNLNLESIASTTTSSTPKSQSFASSFFANIFAKITTWLADVGNGIGSVFANVFNAKEKICVDGECLTKMDIRALLDLVNSQTLNDTPTPEPTPEITPEPSLEPSPEPAPEPEPSTPDAPAEPEVETPTESVGAEPPPTDEAGQAAPEPSPQPSPEASAGEAEPAP
ncbi:MAG: Na-Ca exchanger/integrin-beta4, partial [Parcubacteria group bacterium GW2011_GWA2_50_10b]